MPILHAGTVTFLFSDIEGSTQLWERHPEGMKSALARHDAILRQAIEANRGQVIKTTGDGVHAVFETAQDGVIASLAAQLALREQNWPELAPHSLRVRMGLHTGEAELRGGDYYGQTLNRAARIMSAANGGQILLSGVTAEIVRDHLPADASVEDLGEHRLKDLDRMERLYQLNAAGLEQQFPAVKTLSVVPNNLPLQPTRFLGRETEIEEIKGLLDRSHMVTLTGSGGTGKTRLALKIGADCLTAYPGGVWLLELAALTNGEQVLPALATVFDLRPMPGISLMNTVSDYLRGKTLLLLLDNCEHLMDACAKLSEHFLRTCPHLWILATSREGLGIAGEVSYRVPSLGLPQPQERSFEAICQAEAVQLFVDRAEAANPRFAIGTENAEAVAQVCRRLDGIPLALELAAARTRLFPPEQIAARLNDRFRLLTGGSRTAVPRQQTLRAMIDWSHDLLCEEEKILLRRLSVFVGGWSFEAAEAVCADLDVLSLLDQLVNKSLVVMEDFSGQARYHMLETIRQYAREKLIDANEGVDLRDRHLDYFLRLSQEAEVELRGSQSFAFFERLSLEEDNLRAAIEWGGEEKPFDSLLLLGNLIFYWAWRAGEVGFVKTQLDSLLEKTAGAVSQGQGSLRERTAVARGYTMAGVVFLSMGDTQAGIDAFDISIPLERQMGDPFYLSYALGVRASQKMMVGDWDSAYTDALESAGLVRAMGERRGVLAALPILAVVEGMRGNQAVAEEQMREVRAALESADHPLLIPALLGLGINAHNLGRIDEAHTYFEQGFKIGQRMKSRQMMTIMKSQLAHLDRENGEYARAKSAYRELILVWKDFGQMAAVAHQLESYAQIAASEGFLERAAKLFGAAEALRESIHIPRRGNEQVEYGKDVAALRGRMDEGDFRNAWGGGRALNLDQAIELARN